MLLLHIRAHNVEPFAGRRERACIGRRGGTGRTQELGSGRTQLHGRPYQHIGAVIRVLVRSVALLRIMLTHDQLSQHRQPPRPAAASSGAAVAKPTTLAS